MNFQLSDKNILVTGGAGFIGSNLSEVLLEKGNKVVCLDNFATGKRANIAHLLSNPMFTLIEGDIRNLNDCNGAVEGVDYVLHQAALGSVPRSIKDPITSKHPDWILKSLYNKKIVKGDDEMETTTGITRC